ncbi:phosphopentomutase [Clostridium swellfunianum]|uniref:phosphopentomutase n=1 Tax=Clostridium swellfunianum TaxID=1367462 RepID=UPI0020305240|nr:phosphopentomutase [Clostridium swellfunianum]MCM0649741.1 phosphopentomutase [Clostridium swellfunianum]
MNRFIVIVLDSFGVGYMQDAAIVRPEDVGSNTFGHILDKLPDLKLPNLEKLGIMNALGRETELMKKNPEASYGTSSLMHYGADTFYGHQEIMGTKPKKPIKEPFSKSIDKVYEALKAAGYHVEYKGDKLKFLLVNGCVTVADNIEADFGQIYNLTSTLDLIPYSEVLKIGKVVREEVEVSRVIPFGGINVTVEDILAAVEEKEDKFIGINAPKSGVYNEGYQVIHLGYGINPEVQVPTILGKKDIPVVLLGKVADIVENNYGKSIPCVDTEEVMKLTIEEMDKLQSGFICTNVQETDLAGHAENVERYAEKLRVADKYIGEIMNRLQEDDILIVMADHGNDPTIGHSHHTRENVPILTYGPKVKSGFMGHRDSLSDVGATAMEYFNSTGIENGKSFLNKIIKS